MTPDSQLERSLDHLALLHIKVALDDALLIIRPGHDPKPRRRVDRGYVLKARGLVLNMLETKSE